MNRPGFSAAFLLVLVSTAAAQNTAVEYLLEGYSLGGQWEVLYAGATPTATAAPQTARAAAPVSKSPQASAEQPEWLAACSRCPSPTVVSKSGIGTARATAEARMTHEELKNWCAESGPGNVDACLRQQMAEACADAQQLIGVDAVPGLARELADDEVLFDVAILDQ